MTLYLWAQKISEYPSLITGTLHTNRQGVALADTSLRDGPRIVKLNDYWVDVESAVPTCSLSTTGTNPDPSEWWGWWSASKQHQLHHEGGTPQSQRTGDDRAGAGRPSAPAVM